METLSEAPIERKRLGGGRLAAIVLLYACLIGLSVLTWFNGRRAAETASLVDHTRMVLGEIDATLAAVVRDTAVVRGYLLTGDPEFLKTFDPAGSDLLGHLRLLGRLTADNPSQRSPLLELRTASLARVAELDAAVRARQEGGLAAAIPLVSSAPRGRIREAADRMRSEERKLLDQREHASRVAFRSTSDTLVIGAAVLGAQLTLLVILLNLEITRQRRAESIVAENSDRLLVTLRSIGDAVIVTDEQGRITFANPVAEAMTGWSTADARGLPAEEVFRIVNENSRQPVESPIRQALERGSVVGLANHTILIARDGTETPIADSGAPIRDDRGVLRGVVLVFRDITASRRAERDRVAALRTAEEASAQKDRFLAVLSHELRTPLTPVLATIQRIDRRLGGEDELAREIRMIRRNIELEALLIDDLLDVTGIAQGKIAIRHRTLDLHEKILHVLENCRHDAAGKGVELEASLEAPEHFVDGDPARLQQVLWNVVKNAIKFTPTGGRVSARTEAAAPGRIRLTVADTGIGIKSEKLASIFDAFEQGEATITRRFGGLGLGLAISKAFVEAHGGTIRAESAGAGQGSSFVIELPAMARPESFAPPPDARPRTDGGAWSILVVDDHMDTASAIEAALKEAGKDVRVAGDIASAIALHRERPADLLITDVGLPDGDGVGLLSALGEIHPLRGIVVSGYGMEADLRRSREAGFAAHLTKPFNVARLEEAIDQAMSALSGRRRA